MQLLVNLLELEQGKSRQLFPLCCQECRETFHKPKNQIQAVLADKSRSELLFCSPKCAYEARTTKIGCICCQCDAAFQRTLSQMKRSSNHFCSQSCAAAFNNTHKTKGTRRSKLEVWLEAELTKRYSTLEIHFSRKDAINSELDIYIPSLKLAFELNGIFHYEPIYGADKLKQIQTNDGRKYQACLERGIELCIIDTSKETYFKPEKGAKYLDIIQRIIDNKLVVTE